MDIAKEGLKGIVLRKGEFLKKEVKKDRVRYSKESGNKKPNLDYEVFLQ